MNGKKPQSITKPALAVLVLALLGVNLRCMPAREATIEQLVEEFSGGSRARSREPADLKEAYSAVIDSLLPGMAAEPITERRSAQRAFESICHHAARPGAPTERVALCSAIVEKLGEPVPEPAAVWMIRQLERMGRKESVQRLSVILSEGDPRMREAARRALEHNPAATAGDALLAALRAARDSSRQVALINALAARGDPSLVGALAPYGTDEKPEVVFAAVAALGQLGGHEAAANLKELRRGADEELRARSADALLRVADKFVAVNQPEEATTIFLDLYLLGENPALRVAALGGLASAEGEKALPRLLTAIRSEGDPQMRMTAVRFAQELPGPEVTRKLAAELLVASTQVKVYLLEALGDRGDSTIKPVIAKELTNHDPAVRLAAIRALSKLGDGSDALVLAEFAAGADGDERDAAREGLVRLRGDDVDASILSGVNRLDDAEARAELIRALGERGYEPAIGALLATAEDQDATVRAASFDALAKLAAPEHVSVLIALLIDESEVRDDAADAVVAVSGKISDRDRRADAVIAVMDDAGHDARASLLEVLGRVQGASALTTIRGYIDDDDPEIRDAAVRALTAWEDTGPLEDLLTIASSSDESTHRVLSLRAYVRLIRVESDRNPSDTLRMLEGAMELAGRTEDRRLVISAIGDVVDLEALKLARGHLDDALVRDESASAVISIARGLSSAYPDESIAAVDQILAMDTSQRVRRRATRAIEFIERHRGYITSWEISGPYLRDGLSGEQLMETVFAPERRRSRGAKWTDLTITDPQEPWVFDLEEAVGGGERCVYVRTTVSSPSGGPAVLELGSDDGVKVWLNGEVVHVNNASRGHSEADDKVDVNLRPGNNTLMLKIIQRNGGWAFSCGVKASQ